jgi:two-component system cell cycle response regulator DivK
VAKKVLIVEDNELNLKLFTDLLTAHGFAIEGVRDGRLVEEKARAFAPDLIVMDIQLPHVGGLDLIRRLKADAVLGGVPIMAVTAYAAKGDEERIRSAGAQAYVAKPVTVKGFLREVEGLL